MNTTSHWAKTAALPHFPPLDRTVTVDVAVVGAGITGITAAYLLKHAGLKVALLERGRCGMIDTAHTTAHLTAVTDRRLAALEKNFGAAAAKAVWDAGTAAIDRIHALVRAGNTPSEFKWVPGFLHAASATEDQAQLQREAACARGLGINAEYAASVPLFGRPGVVFPRQALFHPLHYLAGLLAGIPGGGSHVWEESPVGEIADSPRHLRTANGRVNFSHLIIATHNPLQGNTGLLQATFFQSKLSLYTSYALGARVPGPVTEGCFWDTADPYNYLRCERSPQGSYVVYGGEDHKTGQTADTVGAYERLEQRLRTIFPDAAVDARWSGQVIETNDGLPYIGEVTDRQFIATGFGGNGLTFGTLAAMMAVDWLERRPSRWQELFSPARQPFGRVLDYLRENADFPVQMIRGWLAQPEAASVRELDPGQGKIVLMDNHKVAAYRDERGRIELCSAVCPHLQCIVGWNQAEKTWDCPCHGSRFQPDGTVISGPAEENLTRLAPATGRPVRRRRRPAPR